MKRTRGPMSVYRYAFLLTSSRHYVMGTAYP